MLFDSKEELVEDLEACPLDVVVLNSGYPLPDRQEAHLLQDGKHAVELHVLQVVGRARDVSH